MIIKKTLSSLFLALVIGSISYPVFLFANSTDGNFTTKVLIVFGAIGLIFFIVGIGLIRTLKSKY
ncbi:MAG: hypothetical protein JJE44_11500 [Flavobacteriaceae bacterium]|nr:hypothetical protein [Flavobacteriaceae bacterium]